MSEEEEVRLTVALRAQVKESWASDSQVGPLALALLAMKRSKSGMR